MCATKDPQSPYPASPKRKMLRASKPNDEFLPISPTNSATSTDHSLNWRMRPIVASRRVHAAEDRNGSPTDQNGSHNKVAPQVSCSLETCRDRYVCCHRSAGGTVRRGGSRAASLSLHSSEACISMFRLAFAGLVAIYKGPKLFVRHSREFASVAGFNLFHVMPHELPAQLFGPDCSVCLPALISSVA
jgi:hypothetical protein